MTPIALASLLAVAAVPPVSEPVPAVDALREAFLSTTAWIIEAARRVPADRFDFRPTESVRTVGQLIGHIVDGNAYYCKRASGQSPEWAEPVALSGSSKDELIRHVERSMAECTKAYQDVNAARVGDLVANIGHINLHYGNLVTYLRILGLTPPSS